MLEQFLTGIDISFMIFLAQSACWFLFSYQLSFTWFCIGSAALWYFRVLFIFNSPLNTTNIVLLHWSWQFWSRPTHWQTSHHLLLLLWQNRHLPIYLQPGKVHETMLIIHLWQRIALVLILCLPFVTVQHQDLLACRSFPTIFWILSEQKRRLPKRLLAVSPTLICFEPFLVSIVTCFLCSRMLRA